MGQMIEMRRRYGGRLPYDRRVEWLEVTKSSSFMIVTDIEMEDDVGFGMEYSDFSFSKDISGYVVFFGTFWSQKYRAIFFAGAAVNLDLGSGIAGGNIVRMDRNRHTLETRKEDGKRYVYYDGNKLDKAYTDPDFKASSDDLRIRFLEAAYHSHYAGRIYNIFIYKGGVIVRDLIPVRVGDVGYMYDKVSRQLFGNAGTGAFVVGPDVVGGVVTRCNIGVYVALGEERRAA